MPKVLVADALSPRAVEVFRARGIETDVKVGLAKAQLLESIADYDGLAVRSATKADREVIAAGRRLKVIGRAGIGIDNIDVAAATARGIVVMNTPFGNSITTAEHAIALMFAVARQIGAADVSTQAGKWEKTRFIGVELHGKTLGLIGCGNIGTLVAERALGLKMRVLAYDPFLSAERAVKIGVEKVELDELLARAEVISLHTPLTEKTRNILDAEALARTRRGVLIVNAARGGLVDEAALRAALENGHVAGAGFDVFTEEPARANVLFGAPNLVATPHLGASTLEAQENVALQVAEQIADFLVHGAVANAVNTASISADEAPRLRPFIGLVDKLGGFAGKLAESGIEAVEIDYEGEVARLNLEPLTATALAALMRPLVPDINMISAPTMLKTKGAPLVESRRESSLVYDSLVRVRVLSGGAWITVAGTVMAGTAKIVEVKGMALEADFHPVMLFVNNSDRPGFIGALGTLLATAQINIATFHLGRERVGGDAIAIVGVDQPVPEALQRQLRELPHVRFVKVLAF